MESESKSSFVITGQRERNHHCRKAANSFSKKRGAEGEVLEGAMRNSVINLSTSPSPFNGRPLDRKNKRKNGRTLAAGGRGGEEIKAADVKHTKPPTSRWIS